MPADAHAPEIRRYLDAAPHLKHADLLTLFRSLVVDAIACVAAEGRRPRVLDLGAGEGSATVAFLESGADVVAVDEDETRLDVLRVRARSYPQTLEIRTEDARAVLTAGEHDYDVVAAVSFLHHVPDYAALVDSALDSLRPGGVFISFQDPLLYASLGPLTRSYSRVAYVAWRLGQGDLRRGAARYLRRRTRGYSATLPEDAEEFHAQRGGVDHRLLLRTFTARGANVRLVLYFSTQSARFQRLGAALGLHNTFALIGGPVG